MVKNLLLLIVAVAMLQLFGSCQRHNTVDSLEVEKGHFKVEFTNLSAQTLAFWETDEDKRGAGELCEKQLHNVSIFVYKDGSDDCVFRRNFSAAEIDKQTSIFSLPEGSYEQGATYDFYAVANLNFGAADDKPKRTDLISNVQEDLGLYLGLTSSDAPSDSIMKFSSIYPAVSGDAVALRNDPTSGKGFVMSSGKVSAAVPADENTPRTVAIPISRLASRLEVRADTTAIFYGEYVAKFGSKLTIDTIKLLNVARKSNLILKPDAIAATQKADYFNICQIPSLDGDDKSCALFYGFENNFSGSATQNKAVEICVYATFDFDGDEATIDDVSKIIYRTALRLSTNGNMLRNTSYQLDININGLTSQEIVTTITVLPWVVVPAEDIEFGS